MYLPNNNLFSYLSTYIWNLFLKNWLPRWKQILTQLRFIHNWVITGIQWMDGALVGAGSLWLYKHTIAIYGYISLNLLDSTGTARGLCPMWHPVHWIFLKKSMNFPYANMIWLVWSLGRNNDFSVSKWEKIKLKYWIWVIQSQNRLWAIPGKNASVRSVHNSFGTLLFLAFLYQWHNLVDVSSADEDQVSFDVNGLHNQQEQAGYGKKVEPHVTGPNRRLLTDEISPAHNWWFCQHLRWMSFSLLA